ncbi:Two-component system, chemotaxis family, protein-glutamate methylesterase/glutaminase [Candidatus Magnetaquicoccaceae bacterium FCR-1]|uniref:Protein-glutamate methylesterase/protein-glutamine glutaminase n=1 Tax=Candidatus Magnetaquiglobus chichijimensis TaxID=3141448 RepID=A0ABQ0C8Z0_9PROT
MIRVVIADDSMMARQILRQILEDAGGIEVVGEATNGRQAVELVRALQPDLVSMDLEMPVMGGLGAIEEIMCAKAVPILVVSSAAGAREALEATMLGALEVIEKPGLVGESATLFVDKVRLLAGVSVVTRLKSKNFSPRPPVVPLSHDACHPFVYPRLFAIASSTGGPQALARILAALPSDFACPVLIAQHISDGFAGGLVEWLSTVTRLPVHLAEDGDSLRAGVVHISPSEMHLTVTPQRRLALIKRVDSDIYRPSCDRLLASTAEVFGSRAVGIILTGMGSDGAAGMLNIHRRGGVTLAQDEATSLIYGMNQVAILAGAVQRIVPLDLIAPEMVRLAQTDLAFAEIGR